MNRQSLVPGRLCRISFVCLWSASLWLFVAAAADDAASKFPLPRVKEPVIPNRIAHLTDFGAVGDGRTLNTEAFAKALTSLARHGGGKLVIPPGLWLSGPIRLQSNIDLHLEAGALLQFTPDY